MRAGRLTVLAPRESAEHLDNPERGFYMIRSFTLCDGMDCEGALADAFRWEEGVALVLAEFNLRCYADGEISREGLDALDGLLRGLRARGKQLIVRFVYDLEGKNLQTEPQSRAVIERHMEQAGEVLRRYEDCIFTLQGLFTGNWGEMNGTRYTRGEDLRALSGRLAAATGELFLAVRTPAQWRRLVEKDAFSGRLASRLGLFNDGIFGSASDMGTYGERERVLSAWGDAWRREDELAFQSELCRRVPNGGEAISGTDAGVTGAAQALRRMRVSYLNRDYDRAVLERWARETWHERGVFDGTDGLAYIEAHLGYRFVLTRVHLKRSFLNGRLRGEVKLRNVGFAPAYHHLRAELVLADGEGRETRCIPLDGDLRSLFGGEDTEKTLALRFDVAPEAGERRICVRVRSEKYGREILLGNDGREPGCGYLIGRIGGK